jgi:hypothetical protein
MHYKTLLLELIRQNPELHNALKQAGTLAATLDRSARELKANHEAWQAELSKSRPQTAPAQIRTEALELALKEMESRFASESAADAANPLSLDDAMMFLRRGTPTA